MADVGVVRRIDELGRVVIPKEFRREMRLREGETVEIFASEDAVVLKKHSPKSIGRSASAYADVIARKLGVGVLISDSESIVDGPSADLGKKLSDEMIKCIEDRVPRYIRTSAACGCREENFFVVPVISGGDPVGGIILRSKSELSECDRRIVEAVGECMAIELD